MLEVKRRQRCWAVALFRQENKQHKRDLHQCVMMRPDCPERNHKHGCNICRAWKKAFKKRDQWFHHVGSVHHMSALAEVCKFKKKKKSLKTATNATVPQQPGNQHHWSRRAWAQNWTSWKGAPPGLGPGTWSEVAEFDLARSPCSWYWKWLLCILLSLASASHVSRSKPHVCLCPRCWRAAPGAPRAESSLHA